MTETIMRARAKSRWQSAGLRILSLFLVLGTWELGARVLDSLLFPTPGATFFALVQLVVQPEFWQALWVSNQALIVGYGCAVLVGIVAGLGMARARVVEQVLNPYLSIMLATPMSALIPILILAAGFGLPARALVVFFFAIVVIIVNTRTGLRTLDPSLLEMARSFGASELQIWRTILIPGALPAIVTGLRLGLGRALTGMVAVELTLVAVGIGRLILDFQGTFEAGFVYATVLVVMLEAILLLGLLRRLEERVAPWNVTMRGK
jgi:NitT/TauT family transport system permease protein